MPIEVIGAGFGRTGTWSTKFALERLGLPCYHMFEVVRNKANVGHLEFWRDVARRPEGASCDWERVFAKYRATIDFPGSSVWRELIAAYPNAKVLLTLHPHGPDAWYDSVVDTIYRPETMWQFAVLGVLSPFGRKMGEMTRELIWRRSLRGTMPDRAKAAARYLAHLEEVKAAAPAERLLIFSVDQGWEPLCRFLGLPIPDEPFPHVNDRAAMRRTMRGVMIGMSVSVAIVASLAIVAAYTLYRIFG